jgi:peptidyl-prolyl cis-trans isomerase SurA
MRRGLAMLLGLGLAVAQPAVAQNPFSAAYTVNEAVITHYDIAQRVQFLEALGATGNVRALAIEQLTEDRVKVQAAATLGLELPPEAIEAGIEEFGAQRGITVEDVERVLDARGIDRQTLLDFVEAGLLWRELVGGRFRPRAMPSEAELDAALDARANQPVEIVQLAEIAIPFEERGEEATLELGERIVADLRRGASFSAAVRQYSRGSSAGQGGLLDPLPASRLPPAIRGQILLLRPGEVAGPLPISGGIAILQLVSVREAPPSAVEASAPEGAAEVDAREALREQLFNERITSFGNGYLQELMRDALIIEQ